MGDVSVRPALVPADLDQIVALYAEEARWHAEQWPDDFRVPDGGSTLQEELLAATDDPSRCLLVAEVGQRLVGLVCGQLQTKSNGGLARYEGPVMYVADLVVTSDHRQRGIGALLMEELERSARQRGAATVTLFVHDRNLAALGLYRRQGFRRVRVQMRKDLLP